MWISVQKRIGFIFFRFAFILLWSKTTYFLCDLHNLTSKSLIKIYLKASNSHHLSFWYMLTEENFTIYGFNTFQKQATTSDFLTTFVIIYEYVTRFCAMSIFLTRTRLNHKRQQKSNKTNPYALNMLCNLWRLFISTDLWL